LFLCLFTSIHRPIVSTVASTPPLPFLPPAPILPLREPLLPNEHLPRRYKPPRR